MAESAEMSWASLPFCAYAEMLFAWHASVSHRPILLCTNSSSRGLFICQKMETMNLLLSG